MSIEIKVPTLPESVTDALVAKWYKKAGDAVQRDENLIDLETDKIMLEVPAPKSGVLKEIHCNEGDTVTADQVLAIIEEGVASAPQADESAAKQPVAPAVAEPVQADSQPLSPSVRRAVAEHDIDVSQVELRSMPAV